MKKLAFLIVALTVATMVIGLLPVHSEVAIYDNVIRLHVIANSDSEEDQALKLSVRDSILERVGQICADAEDYDSALATISRQENLDELCAIAQRTVDEAGYDYKVSISVGREDYPRKNYDSFCFPSGEYTSLKVEIGESDGQNWWCVLFPQLCLAPATKTEAQDKFIEAGFTPEQYKIVTESDSPRYEVKFKILEIIEETFGE